MHDQLALRFLDLSFTFAIPRAEIVGSDVRITVDERLLADVRGFLLDRDAPCPSSPRRGPYRAESPAGAGARGLLDDALWPLLRGCVDAGDLPGARAAWERAMSERDATYFARERGESPEGEPVDVDDDVFAGEGYEGVATAVMAAAVQRRKVPLILNVPNRGAIGGLRDDDVVEVTCLADEHGAHPIAQGAMPEAALALVGQVKLYERLTVTAAVEGSYDAALGALLAHPLVASYPGGESHPRRVRRRSLGAPAAARSDGATSREAQAPLRPDRVFHRRDGMHDHRRASTGGERQPDDGRPARRFALSSRDRHPGRHRPDRGAGRGRDAHRVRCRRIGCRRPRSFGPGPDAHPTAGVVAGRRTSRLGGHGRRRDVRRRHDRRSRRRAIHGRPRRRRAVLPVLGSDVFPDRIPRELAVGRHRARTGGRGHERVRPARRRKSFLRVLGSDREAAPGARGDGPARPARARRLAHQRRRPTGNVHRAGLDRGRTDARSTRRPASPGNGSSRTTSARVDARCSRDSRERSRSS